jgi:hypothetical protein
VVQGDGVKLEVCMCEREAYGEEEGAGGTDDLTSSSGSQALPSSLSVPLITAAGFRDFLPAVSIALPVTCVGGHIYVVV